VRSVAILLAFVSGGCTVHLVDPCVGQAGACVGLHIDSSASISRLSQAEVRITGDSLDMQQTVSLQNGRSSAELPIALAINFPSLSIATPVHIAVAGLLDSNRIGDGTRDVTLEPGQHTSLHIQLRPGPSMDAGNDTDASPDLASSDLAGYVPLTVQLAGTGTGTVSGSGVSCNGSTCAGLYPPGTIVSLAAIPAANATFSGWSGGGCAGTGACTITVDAATTMTATFDWQFAPSHVSATAYRTDAANLSGVTAIDTHALTINGSAPPAGITFVFENGIAVMSVGLWTIDQGVTVSGDTGLVVVAAGAVSLTANGSINASGSLGQPGPGGDAACSMTGLAANGPTGASGGGGDFGGGASAGGGSAGKPFGSGLTGFCGGGRGGDGATAAAYVDNCIGGPFNNAGSGGGGGGAIQISSAVSITIPSGTQVTANGGGGGGGCYYHTSLVPYDHTIEAGGGGAGGEIFLEAPTIQVAGGVFANGGGGGGPRNGTSAGTPGTDGASLNSAAAGGTNNAPSQAGGNGAYSADGQQLAPATVPNPPTVGGGGGGVGRIWLRTRSGGADMTGGALSPPPATDITL
jgi:hypothetical protein